jgi:hypothetical protein
MSDQTTPRPWRLSGTNHIVGGRDGYDYVVATDVDKYDAVFIVCAVNAHDTLLEALGHARDYILAYGHETNMAPTIERIEKAIRAAKGEQENNPKNRAKNP